MSPLGTLVGLDLLGYVTAVCEAKSEGSSAGVKPASDPALAHDPCVVLGKLLICLGLDFSILK